MAFHTLVEFLRMGTHGPYVWSAYGLTLLALVAMAWGARRRRRRLQREWALLQRHES